MKIAIVGSRTLDDYRLVCKYVGFFVFEDIKEIISGGARGADSLAERYAKQFVIPLKVFEAEWDKYGKSAGFIRNQTIVDNCDMVLAFWDGVSRGTADTIEKAKKAKKPTFIVYFDKPKPITPKYKIRGL